MAITHSRRLTAYGELNHAAEAAAFVGFSLVHESPPRWFRKLFASAGHLADGSIADRAPLSVRLEVPMNQVVSPILEGHHAWRSARARRELQGILPALHRDWAAHAD